MYTFAVAAGCSVVAFLLGSLGTRVAASREADVKIKGMHDLVSNLLDRNDVVLASLSKTISAHTSTIKTLNKEKLMLASQLEEATEACAEMEAALDSVNPEEEDDDDEEPTGDSSTVEKQTLKSAKLVQIKKATSPPRADATNKLITLEAILNDCVAKNESIAPETLLGIVTHKLEE